MAKRKSKCYTICYVIREDSDDMEPYTGTWFAYGRTKEEAKASFLREREHLHEFCGEIPADRYVVVNVVEGFSC